MDGNGTPCASDADCGNSARCGQKAVRIRNPLTGQDQPTTEIRMECGNQIGWWSAINPVFGAAMLMSATRTELVHFLLLLSSFHACQVGQVQITAKTHFLYSLLISMVEAQQPCASASCSQSFRMFCQSYSRHCVSLCFRDCG